MARLARTVIPGLAHHITQRGNRRLRTFFEPGDYLRYLQLMAQSCAYHSVEVWAWCLMPNHVHLVAVPSTEDGLRLALGEAHRRYTTEVNHREKWQGHLWQGRFASFVMDARYTLAASRYVELNPVRAGLVSRPEDYPWSSARAHLAGRNDVLVRVEPLLSRVPDWGKFIGSRVELEITEELRSHGSTGRPLGSDEFVADLERQLGRPLRPRKAGRRPASERPLGGLTPTKICMVSPN
jgi:putative transposase